MFEFAANGGPLRKFSLLAVLCAFLACSSKSQTPTPTRQGLPLRPPRVAVSPAAKMVLAAQATAGPAVPNDVLVSNTAGVRQENRPFTVSRFFARGEIANCPQAVVEEQPVESQCDVKTRWDDGSVQHALVTFFATLGPAERLRVGFVNQEPRGGEGLAKEEMLAFADGKWGAGISAGSNVEDNSEPVYTNVKNMLVAWNGRESDTGVRYWLKGPLATQVIVEDKGASPAFDFGWNTPLDGVRNSTDILRNSTEFTIYDDWAKQLAAWPAPMQVYVEAEIMRICQIRGKTVSICGRGLEGTAVADHRLYIDILPDQGWRKAVEAKHKSLHPIFVLTFYRGWKGVKVEAILEDVWTNRLQNQVYNMSVQRDDPPVDVDSGHRTQKVLHAAGTRWRKVFWSGTEPGAVSIDHNLPYMVYSRALPSYDMGRKLPDKAVEQEYQEFLKTDRGEVMGSGQWLKYFPAPGGRPDIAYVSRWYLRYLYSFDPRLEEAMRGNAAASGHIPMHYRESLPDRSYCASSCAGASPNALGRVLSLDARPTINTAVNTLAEARGEDRLQYNGAFGYNGWSTDVPHQSSFAYVPYLVTGDWYFLEELHFWAAYTMGTSSPDLACTYCRNREWGWVATEVRGRGWAMRAVGHAALMSPNGSPEKEYFTAKLNNMVAIHEGIFEIKDGSFYEPCPAGPFDPARTTRWCWGRNVMGSNLPNPLMVYEQIPGGQVSLTNMWTDQDFQKSPPAAALPQANAVPVYAGGSEWMVYYNQIVVGHLFEAGFTQLAGLHAGSLTTRLLHQLQDPQFNPYLVAAYQTPIIKCAPKLDQGRYVCGAGGYMTSWGETLRGFKEVKNEFYPAYVQDPEHGYGVVARAAASFLYPMSADGLSGRAAWQWLAGKIDPAIYDENPMWALVPREINPLGEAYARRLKAGAARSVVRMPPAGTDAGRANSRKK